MMVSVVKGKACHAHHHAIEALMVDKHHLKAGLTKRLGAES